MRKIFMLIGLVALLTLSAYGQQMMMKANIPFEFTAANKVMPAGAYEFVPQPEKLTVLVRNATTHQEVFVPVVTRLAADEKTTVRVTFDTVGDKQFLESIWPATEDGYLLHSTKEKHTHKSVTAG